MAVTWSNGVTSCSIEDQSLMQLTNQWLKELCPKRRAVNTPMDAEDRRKIDSVSGPRGLSKWASE